MATTTMKNFVKAVTKLVDDVQSSTCDKVFEFVKDKVTDPAFQAAYDEFKKNLKADEFAFGTLDSKKGGEKKKRTPSKYNTFIGSKIKELKEKHPSKDGKELMKLAIESWKAETH